MTVTCEGQFGDAVYVMGILHGLKPWPHKLLLRSSQVTGWRPGPSFERSVEALLPLADAQEYIEECRVAGDGEDLGWDSGGFRGAGLHDITNTLMNAHLAHLSLARGINQKGIGQKAWLRAKPSRIGKDRVIVSRSSRYQNPKFPWKQIVDFYGDRLLFLGVEDEWVTFCSNYGLVEKCEAVNMLEAAEIIAGSLLFIGNQSAPNALAEGLKHPIIQEVCLHIPDCIFKRESATHVIDGSVVLPGFDKDSLVIPSRDAIDGSISVEVAPSGGWSFPGLENGKGAPRRFWNYDHLKKNVMQMPEWSGKSSKEIKDAIFSRVFKNLPMWRSSGSSVYELARMAMENAEVSASQVKPKLASRASN